MLTNKPQPIGLRELISRVKRELLEDADPTEPLFLVGNVSLEISFTVERKMNGGIDLQVVQGGAEKTMSDAQTIKVTLEPLLSVDEMRKSITSKQKQKAKQSLTREHSPSRG